MLYAVLENPFFRSPQPFSHAREPRRGMARCSLYPGGGTANKRLCKRPVRSVPHAAPASYGVRPPPILQRCVCLSMPAADGGQGEGRRLPRLGQGTAIAAVEMKVQDGMYTDTPKAPRSSGAFWMEHNRAHGSLSRRVALRSFFDPPQWRVTPL